MSNFFSRHGRGPYRSRNGVILGVCRGLGEYFDFSVSWIRIIMVVIFVLSGFWPVVGIYFLAALIMKPEPVRPIETEDEQDFYDSYIHSRRPTLQRLKRRFQNLDRRIQRMEDTVTAREFDWDQKLRS